MNTLFNEILNIKKLVKQYFDKDTEIERYDKTFDPFGEWHEWNKKLKKLKKERKKIKNNIFKLL
jgi:hypothetical protein